MTWLPPSCRLVFMWLSLVSCISNCKCDSKHTPTTGADSGKAVRSSEGKRRYQNSMKARMKLDFMEQIHQAVSEQIETIALNWVATEIPLAWSKYMDVGTQHNSLQIVASSTNISSLEARYEVNAIGESSPKLSPVDSKVINTQIETLHNHCTSGSPECPQYAHWLSNNYQKELSLSDSMDDIFQKETFNVFIAGGGPVGLFLANAIASKFSADQVRVIVAEKRTFSNGTKRPYARKWPTDLYYSAFEGIIDPRLLPLFKQFLRKNPVTQMDMLRTQIRIIETVLFLSCRSLGVRFLFEPVQGVSCSSEPFRRSAADNMACRADVRVDATGNRLHPFNKMDLIEANRWNHEDMMQMSNHSLSQISGKTYFGQAVVGPHVVSHEGILFPLFGNLGAQTIQYLKILHLPKEFHSSSLSIQQMCEWQICGQIYYWYGSPRDLTLFFNLRWHEVIIFRQLIDDQVVGSRLNESFMERMLQLSQKLGRAPVDIRLQNTLRSLLEMCRQYEIPGCAEVRVAGPYEYDPFFITPNATKSFTTVGDPGDWIRVGDSVYQGDFTLGNGLGSHLQVIGKAIQRIELKNFELGGTGHADL